MDHIVFKVEILSNEDREWHESFSLVLGPDDPVEAVLGEITIVTVTILDQEAAGSLILPAPPIVSKMTDITQSVFSHFTVSPLAQEYQQHTLTILTPEKLNEEHF